MRLSRKKPATVSFLFPLTTSVVTGDRNRCAVTKEKAQQHHKNKDALQRDASLSYHIEYTSQPTLLTGAPAR